MPAIKNSCCPKTAAVAEEVAEVPPVRPKDLAAVAEAASHTAAVRALAAEGLTARLGAVVPVAVESDRREREPKGRS